DTIPYMIDVIRGAVAADGRRLVAFGRDPAIHRAVVPLRMTAVPAVIGIGVAELLEMEGMVSLPLAVEIGELPACKALGMHLSPAELVCERSEIVIEGPVFLAQDHDMLDLARRVP